MLAGLGLSFMAGVLSTLSPCVLPLLPVVLGAAISQHRYGAAALAAGLACSFTIIGLFVATIGFSIGIDGGVFRMAAALVMLGVGTVLAIPPLQTQFSFAAGPVGNWAQERFGGFSPAGLSGQFAVGLLLGAVWGPCVGPTLGAASVLAAQGKNLEGVALTMVVFGLGAALPLVILGWLSRETLMHWRNHLARAGGALKVALGIVLIVTAMTILSGFDKVLETTLVNISPDWLSTLTTRF